MKKIISQKIYSIIFSIFVTAFVFVPLFSFAQQLPTGSTNSSVNSSPACVALFNGSINTLKDIIDYGICLISKSIIPLLYVIAIAVFIYGVIQYFLNPNNTKQREDARKYIIGALLGLFVLISVSGIIEILRNTFGITGSPIPLLPETQ